MRFLRNPWLWVAAAAAWPLPLLWYIGVPADTVTNWVSGGVFLVLGGLFAIYAQRAPFAMLDGDAQPASRNAVGWLLLFFFIGAMIFYGWVFRNTGRPDWLAATYWLPSIWWGIFVGAVIMASSTQRNGQPLIGGKPTGFLLGVITASALYATKIGEALISPFVMAVKWAWGGIVRMFGG